MRDTSVLSTPTSTSFYKLRHVLPGAISLAAIAGYINSVVLGFFHVPVSHMTGAVSRLGISVASKERGDLWPGATIILGYVVGSAFAGLLVGATHLKPSRRFGVALVFEGILLAVATWLLHKDQQMGLPAAALACGCRTRWAAATAACRSGRPTSRAWSPTSA